MAVRAMVRCAGAIAIASVAVATPALAQIHETFFVLPLECKFSATRLPTSANVTACANTYKKPAALPPGPPSGEPAGALAGQQPLLMMPSVGLKIAEAAHTSVLQQYSAYIEMRAAAERANAAKTPNPVVSAQDQAAIAAFGQSVHNLLKAHDLEETSSIVGQLRTGSALSSTGAFGDSPTAKGDSATNTLVHIEWETAHVGSADRASGRDFALRGKFGLQPTTSLVRSTETTEIVAALQEALVIDGGLDFTRFWGRSEATFTPRFGFIRIGEPSQIIQRNGESVLAIPANKTDQAAPYFELVGSYSLFEQPMPVVHLSKTALSPQLFIEGGLRRDSRFRSTGLTDDFKNPEWRLVIRFMLDGLKILDNRTAGEGNKVFSVGFGFDYERPIFGSTIPSGFRILIKGDLDLLKALKGGHVDSGT